MASTSTTRGGPLLTWGLFLGTAVLVVVRQRTKKQRTKKRGPLNDWAVPEPPSKPLKVLVTGFCDWAVTDPPSNIWRCYTNPSGRLLIGDAPEVCASTQTLAEQGHAALYQGLLCTELRKITQVTVDAEGTTRPVLWDFIVAPTIWQNPFPDSEVYDNPRQTPFTRLKDLTQYDIVYHLGLGSYSPPWPIFLELGAIDYASFSFDARKRYPDGGADLAPYAPINHEEKGDEAAGTPIIITTKYLRNSTGQIQVRRGASSTTLVPPWTVREPHSRSPVAAKITRITGMTTTSTTPYTIVAALAREDNSYICNQTNWTSLALMNQTYDNGRKPAKRKGGRPGEVYFMHIPWGNAPGKNYPERTPVHTDDDFTDLAKAAADVILNVVDFYGRGLHHKNPKSRHDIETNMAQYNMYSAN